MEGLPSPFRCLVHPPPKTSRILCAPRCSTGHMKGPTQRAHAVNTSQGRVWNIALGTKVTAQPDPVRIIHAGPRIRHYPLEKPTSEHLRSSVTSLNGSAQRPFVFTLAKPHPDDRPVALFWKSTSPFPCDPSLRRQKKPVSLCHVPRHSFRRVPGHIPGAVLGTSAGSITNIGAWRPTATPYAALPLALHVPAAPPPGLRDAEQRRHTSRCCCRCRCRGHRRS